MHRSPHHSSSPSRAIPHPTPTHLALATPDEAAARSPSRPPLLPPVLLHPVLLLPPSGHTSSDRRALAIGVSGSIMADGQAGGPYPPELSAYLLPMLMNPWMMTSAEWKEFQSVAKFCPAFRRHIRILKAMAKNCLDIRQHMEQVLSQANYKTRLGLMPWPLEADWVQEMKKELQKRGLDFSPKRTDCGFVPDWNIKRGSWDEYVAKALHIVRLHQITEFDPVQGCSVYTRFCRYNLAFFDFEKESKAERGMPFLELTSYDHKLLEGSVNVVSLKIDESKVGYPVRVFGTVLVRDQVDYKCVYLFRRGKHDPQLIDSPDDMLTLTDPCRGLAVTSSMFFEINLKIVDDSGEMIFSKGVIEHDACVHEEKLETRLLTSWHSTLRLDYTPVPFALIATITVMVLDGPNVFNGEVTAWTTGNKNELILYDSKVAGTSTSLGDDGSIMLTRRMVAVPLDEKLVVRIQVQDAIGREGAYLEDALGHFDDGRTFCQEPYILRVKTEWAGNSKRKNVFKYVGQHIKMLL